MDLRDGKLLIKLLEVLSGERLVSTLNAVHYEVGLVVSNITMIMTLSLL